MLDDEHFYPNYKVFFVFLTGELFSRSRLGAHQNSFFAALWFLGLRMRIFSLFPASFLVCCRHFSKREEIRILQSAFTKGIAKLQQFKFSQLAVTLAPDGSVCLCATVTFLTGGEAP